MAILQQPIRIRLQHNILAIGEAVQYDTYREFHFIFDDYEIPLETTDIRIYLEKPSGRAIYNYGTLINGEVVYQPTSQTLGEYGTCIGQVQIVNNDAILTTFPFKLEVQKSLVDNTSFISKDEFLILDELIKTTREQSKEIAALNKRVTDNENSRVSSEQSRVNAESKRVSTEQSRVNAESKRVSTEQLRVNAESKRVSTEQLRVNAENTRINQEKARVDSEQSRVNAESKRQQDTASAIKRCNDALETIDTTVRSLVNDTTPTDETTYSSNKITSLIESHIIVSKSEPVSQLNGGLWLLEE